MNGLVEFLNRAGELWWQYVLHATWQAALLAALIIIMVKLGRRLPSPLRYWLLIIALIKFAIPPMLSIPTGIFTHAGPKMDFEQTAVPLKTEAEKRTFNSKEMSYAPDTRDTMESPIEPEEASKSPVENTSDTVVKKNAEPTKPIEPIVALKKTESRNEDKNISVVVSSSSFGWKTWLMLIHFAGIVSFAVWVIWNLLPLRRTIRNSHEVKDGTLYGRYFELCRKMSFKRIPRLLVTSENIAPMAYGLFHPAVVIPHVLAEGTDKKKFNAILTHELAHISRRDILFNWLQITLTTLWWFNPLLWLLNREVRRVREECCDDFVLSRGESSDDDYCSTILHTASTLAVQKNIGARLGFADRLHPLGSRIKRIMDTTLRRVPSLPIWGIIIIVIVAALLLPGIGCQKKQEPTKESEETETTAEPGSRPELNEVLLQSAKEGNFTGVKSLISRGAFINAMNDEGATPLYLAVENNHKEIAEYLLNNGADIKKNKKEGDLLINIAITKGYIGIAKNIMQSGADINAIGLWKRTAVHVASETENVEIMRLLLDKGADIYARDFQGKTPFALAASKGNIEIMKMLIDKSRNTENFMIVLNQALASAAYGGYLDIAKILLAEGADVNSWMVIDNAVSSGKLEMVKLLLERGAKVNDKSTVWRAVDKGNAEILKALLEAGANPNSEQPGSSSTASLDRAVERGDKDSIELLINAGVSLSNINELLVRNLTGPHLTQITQNRLDIAKILLDAGASLEKTISGYSLTPLQCVSRDNKYVAAKFLVQNGANVNNTGNTGSTPLHIAVELGNKETAELLINEGADIEALNKDVLTPLFLAVSEEEKDIASLLISKGANINVIDKWGRTPIYISIVNQNKPMAKILLDAGANPDVPDKNGKTALDEAIKANNKALIDLLKQYSKAETQN